jgi:hypothetical protein
VADADWVRAAEADLRDVGYEILHSTRTEPWGHTVVRLLSPEGLIIGISYAPSLHDSYGAAASISSPPSAPPRRSNRLGEYQP